MIKFKTKLKWNSKPVIKKVKDDNIKFLYKASAYVRTIITRTIKKGPSQKGKRSKAGNPPISQKGILRKTIEFWVDVKARSAKIGPAALPGSQSAPEVLEFSGIVKSGWMRGRYLKPRPYLGPALDKATPSFSKIRAKIK